MDRFFLKSLIAGLGGGALGFLILFYFMGGSFNIFALSGYSLEENPETTPSVIPVVSVAEGFWDKLAAESSFSSVGIQVFQNNTLARQGSGIILSSDGLIMTTADLAFKDAVYQIFYEDKVFRGLVEAIDYKSNLFILKSLTSYSAVADLDVSHDYKSGQDILLIGKLVDVSSPTTVSQRGTISYVTEGRILIDTAQNNYLSGAGVIGASGKFIGMSYLRSGKTYLIKSGIIEPFFKEYLDKNTSK